jgi:bacterioferritin
MSLSKNPAAKSELINKLNEILELELAGVARYLHYSLMIRGSGRIPITKFFKEQAIESFNHASIIGEKITALGGHPSLKAQPVKETNEHSTQALLKESLEAERSGLEMYKKLVPLTEGDIALEEMVRGFVALEQSHIEEVEKMLVD